MSVFSNWQTQRTHSLWWETEKEVQVDYDIQVKMTSWQIEISEMFTNSHKVKTRIYKAYKV